MGAENFLGRAVIDRDGRACGQNFSAAFSRDRKVTEAMRDGGTKSSNNSSVQTFNDMMR